jgi:nitric oxide reductase NorD protein
VTRGAAEEHPDCKSISRELDLILEVEFSFRNTRPAAEGLAALDRSTARFAIDWVRRAAATHVELGYRFSLLAPQALTQLDRRGVEAWLIRAMDHYDRFGLRPALQAIQEIDLFTDVTVERSAGALLEERRGVLERFLQALSGRRLLLAEAATPSTDGETLYLPPLIARLPEKRDNELLLKSMVALLWAETRYGTLNQAEQLIDAADGLITLYHAFETERLEALIGRHLPGLHRDMARTGRLLQPDERSEEWSELTSPLRRAGSSALESMALARAQLGRIDPPPPRPYQGRLDPERVVAARSERTERERSEFRLILTSQLASRNGEHQPAPPLIELRQPTAAEENDALTVELLIDDQPQPLPETFQRLASSILLDFGEIPPDYLTPAGPGDYDPDANRSHDPDRVWEGTYHEHGALLYDEWDYLRQHYRKEWCAVREITLEGGDHAFVEETLRRYAPLLHHLRRDFEGLRDEERILKRQLHGDDVDIDAVVEGLADVQAGLEMDERLSTRLQRNERNIAVAFMVDMSGSTRGWINQAERESLILLCEALHRLDDRYSIHGFSGQTRKRCEIYHIKRFDEVYDRTVQGRIAAIEPRDYTRMGFAIRHLNRMLLAEPARTRLLITLSDGKPDDYDGYRGEYGIEDTRRALQESRHNGIHPYCITIDTEARDYLPHLYGRAAYTVVDDVRQLPWRVSDLYRRVTS